MTAIRKVFSLGCANIMTARDARNLRLFNLWFVTAMVLFAAVTVLLGRRYLEAGPVAWVLVGATIFLLAGAIAAYQRFLHQADELLRKVHLEGLAMGFGAGVLFMIGWRLCERLGAPSLDIDDPLLVMVMAWALGQWIGFRRYGADGEEA